MRIRKDIAWFLIVLIICSASIIYLTTKHKNDVLVNPSTEDVDSTVMMIPSEEVRYYNQVVPSECCDSTGYTMRCGHDYIEVSECKSSMVNCLPENCKPETTIVEREVVRVDTVFVEVEVPVVEEKYVYIKSGVYDSECKNNKQGHYASHFPFVFRNVKEMYGK